MRSITRAFAGATAAVLLLASPAAADQTGPYHGAVREGQYRTHHYDNNPQNLACPAVVATYTIVVTYTPPTDSLTVSVDGESATGSGGVAVLTIQRSFCTAFDVVVTGTSVENVAQYDVTVTRGAGPVVEI